MFCGQCDAAIAPGAKFYRGGVYYPAVTLDPGAVEAKVYFTVKVSEPYKILRKARGFGEVDILKGEARFRLYDDGWRVESADIGD